MKHSGTWIGGLLLFAAGAGSGWAVRTLVKTPQVEGGGAAVEDEPPPLEVPPAEMHVVVGSVEAKSGELPITLGAPGIVRAAPAAQRKLSSRAAGRVLEILAAPGLVVKQGDLLLRLDPTPAQAALSQARAALAESANRLAEFERIGSARQEIELKTAAQRAISQVALLEAQVARLGPLRADGLVSEKALAEAQQALESARAERVLSERAQAAFTSSGESLQRATLTSARDAAQVAASESERALAEVDVHAPSDGQLVEWNVRSGEMLAAGAPLGRWLSSVGRELTLQVPVSEASALNHGLRVTWLDSKGESRSGTLVRIESEAESTSGSLEMIAKPDVEDAALLPGLRVFAEIELRRLPSAVLVPERAVLRADDKQVIVVAREGHAVRVPIKVLGRHAGLAAIEGEVHAGDHVIIDGGYNLPDGAGIVERSDR